MPYPQDPYVPRLIPNYPSLAAALLSKLDPDGFVKRVQLVPGGVVAGVYPYDQPDSEC